MFEFKLPFPMGVQMKHASIGLDNGLAIDNELLSGGLI